MTGYPKTVRGKMRYYQPKEVSEMKYIIQYDRSVRTKYRVTYPMDKSEFIDRINNVFFGDRDIVAVWKIKLI